MSVATSYTWQGFFVTEKTNEKKIRKAPHSWMSTLKEILEDFWLAGYVFNVIFFHFL